MGFMNKVGYLLKEGIKSVFTHGFMSFASVSIMVACLLIMGSFALLSVNIQAQVTNLENQNETLAFVDDSLSEEEARAIEPYIRALSNVSDVEFISREEAMEDFRADYDNDEIFEVIEPETFRNRYVIHLKDIAYMADTQTEIGNIEGIADVSVELDIARGLVTARNIVSAVSVILIVVLFVVSVFVMSNTVKLTTFSRREEIAIMRMVGATNSFIRTPFVIEGLFLGILGSVISFFGLWGLYTLVCDKVMAGITGTLVSVVPFEQIMMPVGGCFLLMGVFVGMFGGGIAIRNYLKV